MLRIFRFAVLLLVALSMGMAFAHALELKPKMDYEPATYLLLHRTLYEFFGPPVGGFIEAGAVLSSVALVFFVRRRGRAFLPTTAGALCMVIAHVIWWLWVNPANAAMGAMSLHSPPPDWILVRNQWEYTHLARFLLQLGSLSALLISVLLETPDTVAGAAG